MRALKIAGIVLGGLIGLLLIGAAAVLLLVDPNDYRAEIERRASEASGRSVKIGGQIDLKLFPWIALQIADVSVGNPAGYGVEPFLSVKRADVGVKLMPLLHKEIEVRRVALDGLAANLVSRSDEDNNWKNLGKKDTGSGEVKPAGATPKTSIAGVDIKDAALVYRDEAQKSLTRLSKLNVTTGALGGDAPVPIKMDFDYDDGTADAALSLVIESRAHMAPDSSLLELKQLVVKGKPTRGGTEFSARAPALALDWKAETLAPATFAVTYGELPLSVTATGRKVLSDRVITGAINIVRFSPRKLMSSLGMDAPNTRDAKVLNALTVRSDYRLTEKALALSRLDVRLDDTRIRGSLGVIDLKTKALSFDLDVDTVDVDRYREPEVKPGKGAAKPPPVDLPREALRKLNAKGVLRVGHAKLADMTFDEVQVPVEAAGGRVLVAPKARLFGGSYQGSIVLDARPKKLKLSMNEHVRGIDIGALVNAAFDSTRVVGRGDANIVLNGAGNTDVELLKSLAGNMDTNVRQGAFNGIDLWYELRRAMALIKQTQMPTRSGPVRTQFKTLSGSATLAGGVVRNDDLSIDMDYLKARGKGKLAVADQSIDYRLVAEVYKLPPAGTAGSELADVKALEIPIAITGTLADMKVRPDLGDLAKARLNKEVDKRKEDLRKKLDKKLEGKLKDLLNH